MFTLQHFFCFEQGFRKSNRICANSDVGFEDENCRTFYFFNAGIVFLPFTTFSLSFLHWT